MSKLLETVSVRGYLGYALLGLGCGIAGTTLGVAAVPRRPQAPVPTVEVAPAEEPVRVAEPPQPVKETFPGDDRIVAVVAADGASYLDLVDLDPAALPRHGKLRMIEDDYVDGAIAKLVDIPADVRAWQGREVIVDGSCHATVTGFALVARLTGDPGYASLDTERADPKWSAASIVEHGHVMIAAKLDRCPGRYARAAAAPPIRVFQPGATSLVAEAERRVLASEPAAAAAKEWATYEQQGSWFEHDLIEKVVADPQTGTTWISIHGHADYTCGGPDINLWGLFRVEPDGTLTTVQLRPLGALSEITDLVDTDGDGVPELVGRGWINPDMLITDAAGNELVSFETPFYGCPC